MSRTASLATLFLLLSASAPVSAQARVERVKGSGIDRTVSCASTPVVEVTGERNRVRLTGSCDKVKLSGLGHQVVAEGLGRVEMSGLDHRVEWQFATAGSRPKVSDNGIGNQVVQVARPAAEATAKAAAPREKAPAQVEPERGSAEAEAGAASSAPGAAAPRVQEKTGRSGVAAGTIVNQGSTLEINGTGIRRTVQCDGGSIQVNGTGNTLVAHGECDRIEVNGMGNRVRVESSRTLAVHGINQQVAWVRGPGDEERPRISNEGMNNRVVRIELEELDRAD